VPEFDQIIRDAVAQETQREDASSPMRHRARRDVAGIVTKSAFTVVACLAIGALTMTAYALVVAATLATFFTGLVLVTP